MENFVTSFIKELAFIFRELGKVSYKGVRYVPRTIDHRRGLKNLRSRGLIEYKNDSINFTKSGRVWLDRKIHPFFMNQRWDKKWRVIIFDIPEELHLKRDKFRRKLRHLGCVTLQKSSFVFPYSCELEISEICNQLKIVDYVDIIIAESIGSKEGEVKKYFKI